jgi:hypothetical protein
MNVLCWYTCDHRKNVQICQIVEIRIFGEPKDKNIMSVKAQSCLQYILQYVNKTFYH